MIPPKIDLEDGGKDPWETVAVSPVDVREPRHKDTAPRL